MKRNSIFAIGFGVLLGVGLLTPGCGDSGTTKKDASGDAKKDGVSADGAASTGGVRGTGGSPGTGGATTAAGGAVGTGGATTGVGGAPGTGGATGAGGATGVDAGLDTPRLDVPGVDQRGTDTADVPLINPETGVEGGPRLDTGSVDQALDQGGIDSPVVLDVAVDESADLAPVDAEIDTTGLDGNLD